MQTKCYSATTSTLHVAYEQTGPGAAQVAAHRTRDRKEILSPEEVLERYRELAAQHGHQAGRVVALAREQTRARGPETGRGRH
jgi:hypothetical protein